MALFRAFSTAHAPPRTRFTAPFSHRDETVLYYPGNEAAGAALIDQGDDALNMNTRHGVGDGATSSLWGETTGTGARTFDGTTIRLTTAIGATLATKLGDPKQTLDMWLSPDALAAEQVVVEGAYYQGAPTTAAACIGRVKVLASGALVYEWQTSALAWVGVTSAAATIAAGEAAHVWCRRRPDPANPTTQCLADIYKNGLLVATASGLGIPVLVSSSARIIAGGSLRDGAGTTLPAKYFTGTVAGIRWHADDLGADAALDGYARGVRWWDEATLVATSLYRVAQRVLVEDAGGVWRDLSSLWGRDFVIATRVRNAADDSGPSGDVEVKREAFKFKLAPFATLSPVNTDLGGAVLLQGGRRIKIQRAMVPASLVDIPYWAWATRLSGFIGKVGWASDPMTLEVRGEEYPLQQTFILNEKTYPAAASLEVQLQTLVDDYRPGSADNPSTTAGYKGQPFVTATPRIWVADSSFWALGTYQQGQMTVWDACTRLVEQRGMRFCSMWDDLFQAWRICLMEPERTKTTPDITLSPDVVLAVPRLEHDTQEVRNRSTCRIYDAGAAATSDGEAPFTELVATDATSIAKYGLQACSFGDFSAYNIDQVTEGQALVDACVADNKEPLADGGITLRYMHHLDVEDMVRLSPDNQRWDTNLDLAVVGWEDEVSATRARLDVDLHAKPVGKTTRTWRDRWIGEGTGRQRKISPAVLAGISVVRLDGALDMTVTSPVGRLRRDIDRVEFHAGATPGFTPSASTFYRSARDNRGRLESTPGASRYLKAIARDARGNITAASAEVNEVARHRGVSLYGKAHLSATLGTPLIKGVNIFTLAITNDPFTALSTSGGRTFFTAPVNGTYRFDCQATAAIDDPGADLADSIRIQLRLNGVTIISSGEAPAEDDEVVTQHVSVMLLDAGDEVEFIVLAINNSADYPSNFTLQGDAGATKTWFTFTLVDEAT